MCVWVQVALMAVSAAASIAAANSQARAKNAQAESEARIQENNTIIARDEAAYAQGEAARAASQKRREVNAQLGAQQARMGSSGVVVNSGSTLEKLVDMAEIGERDVVRAGQSGDADAWRSENKARSSETAAKLARAGKVNVAQVTAQAGLSALSSSASSARGFFGAQG